LHALVTKNSFFGAFRLPKSRRIVVVTASIFVGSQFVEEWRNDMAKYGKKAQNSVKRAMRKKKQGTLTSGKSKKKVTSRKQAIAIGLSEARKKGAKAPKKAKKKAAK
jgi:hypothetical protein